MGDMLLLVIGIGSLLVGAVIWKKWKSNSGDDS